MPRRTTKQRGGSTFMKDNVHWQTEKKSYVNPLNCHPSGKFRYSCCLSAAAVGRSSGFLKQEGKCKPIATTRGNNPHGKTFLLKSSARGDKCTSSGTGGNYFCRAKCSRKTDMSHITAGHSEAMYTSHLEHDCDHFLTYPRPLSRPHFQYDTSNTPNIDLESVPLLLGIDNFRCHPEYRALHGCEGTACFVICPLRDSKVGYFANTRRFHQEYYPP